MPTGLALLVLFIGVIGGEIGVVVLALAGTIAVSIGEYIYLRRLTRACVPELRRKSGALVFWRLLGTTAVVLVVMLAATLLAGIMVVIFA